MDEARVRGPLTEAPPEPAARQKTETHYRVLLEATAQIVWATNGKGEAIDDLRSWCDFTGLSLADCAGTGWLAAIHPQDRTRIAAHWEAAKRSRTGFHSDFRVRGADGRYRHIETHGVPVFDSSGEIQQWVGTCTDVHDQKRAQRGLTFLTEASRVLTSSLDLDTILRNVATLAVPVLADFSHIDLFEETTGQIRRVAYAHVDPVKHILLRRMGHEYPPHLDAHYATVRAIRTGQSILVEKTTPDYLREIAVDATQLQMLEELALESCIVVPLVVHERTLGSLILSTTAESGRVYGANDLSLAEELARRVAIAVEHARLYERERAARRRAERAAERTARLQTITAALSAALTPEGIARVVVEHTVAELGARAAALATADDASDDLVLLHTVGYSPEAVAEFARIPLATSFPLTDAVRTGAPVILCTAAERDVRYPHLAALRKANGNGAMIAIPLLLDGRAVGAIGVNFAGDAAHPDDERRFLGAIAHQCAMALDRARLYETERAARAEAELARVAAETANRTRTEFVATMSHELRTPLNAIAGYVELLEMGLRGAITDAQRADLERIKRSQERLLSLVNDVLTFAGIDSGHVTYTITDVPLGEVLVTTETLVMPQVHAKGIVCKVMYPDRQMLVRADRERLGQIVLNLMANAIKFTAPGGHVSLRCESRDGMALIHVADTGRGIPEAKLEQIFEPFVQVEGGHTRTAEGTGLGLAISRELAAGMNGSVSVVSEVGRGSTFTLAIPLSPERGARDRSQSHTVSTDAFSAPANARMSQRAP